MSIFPGYIPESERGNKGRRAELLVYDHLATLRDKWTILYHRSIKRETDYGISDREADFIIAHPDLGVLVLEVKGGGIAREGGDWYTIPLSELIKPPEKRQRYRLKQSPYDQATDTAKQFERKLDQIIKDRRLRTRTFKINVAVCFPDIEVPPDLFLGMEAPRSITIDRNGLSKIQQSLQEVFRVHGAGGANKPGDSGIDFLIEFLAPTWEIDTSLAYQFEDADAKRKELTSEQFDWLCFVMQDNPRSLVSGCAGSGKTVLATHAAKRFANEGKSVLLTCFNRNLGDFLTTEIGGYPQITCGHFHTIGRRIDPSISKAAVLSTLDGLDLQEQELWERPLRELQMAADAKGVRFDAILVDEGQDFPQRVLEALEGLLVAEESHFHIFLDDNQCIYGAKRNSINGPVYARERTLPSWPVFPLTKNLRNTDPIHEQVIRYYHNPARNRPSGIPGLLPVFLPGLGDSSEAVRSALEWLEESGIPPEWIVVLTPRSRRNSAWGSRRIRWGRYSPNWDLHESPGGSIHCCTIHGFKGLERPVVILTELDHLLGDQQVPLLYVALSRAKTLLVVIGYLPQSPRSGEHMGEF